MGREMMKTFSEGISLEEASVSIGRIGRAIEEKICGDVRVLAMMCIGKWWAVWFSCDFLVLQASAGTRSVLSRVECCT